MITIPNGMQGKELFGWLIANKSTLIAEKKYNIKHSDAFRLSTMKVDREGNVSKSAVVTKDEGDVINRSCVINSCWVLDSHKDLHIPGIWKKSLSETKSFYLLQEHELSFKGIITEDIRAFTKNVSWKELGIDASGETECLVFNCDISKDRNEPMFKEYKLNRVKNHSVGMRYVQIEMAVNDEEYKEEFAAWNKYYKNIINKEDADNEGYFFAVKEAKVVEGSAVPIGSNRITPVLNTKSFSEDSQDTQDEPHSSTQKEPLEDERSEWLDTIRKTRFLNI